MADFLRSAIPPIVTVAGCCLFPAAMLFLGIIIGRRSRATAATEEKPAESIGLRRSARFAIGDD